MITCYWLIRVILDALPLQIKLQICLILDFPLLVCMVFKEAHGVYDFLWFSSGLMLNWSILGIWLLLSKYSSSSSLVDLRINYQLARDFLLIWESKYEIRLQRNFIVQYTFLTLFKEKNPKGFQIFSRVVTKILVLNSNWKELSRLR